jgi:hypothetical protein
VIENPEEESKEPSTFRKRPLVERKKPVDDDAAVKRE